LNENETPNVGGRPSKYSPEIEAAAWAYVDDYEKHDHPFPSAVGLCDVIKIGKSTLYDWAGHDEKGFSDILAAINTKQELININKGVTGEFNSAIVKLLLGKHGYSDKAENTIVGDPDKPVTHTIEVIEVADGTFTDT
jgi:hypothetical protein